jgi:hypothetical protein
MFTTAINERIVILSSQLASIQAMLKSNGKRYYRIKLQADAILLKQQLDNLYEMQYKQLDAV